MEPETVTDRLVVAGIEITPEMIARIAKACGPADYRYDSDETVVERVISCLVDEIEGKPPAG